MGSYIIGLYSQATKVKRPSYRIGIWQYTNNNRQVYQVGILYTIFREYDIRGTFKDLYKGYIRVLGNLYSRIRNLSSYINSILSTDRRINEKTKLDIRTVFKALY
jgi:hypothetical protein